MIYAALKLVHLLSLMVWVGGMVFVHSFLRPAVAALEPPLRLRLMQSVLRRFFMAVLAVSLLTLASGGAMIHLSAQAAALSGGQFRMPHTWMLMAGLGTLMVAIFLHIRFALFARLTRAVGASDWTAGGAAMLQIRRWVSVNLALALVIIVVTLLGAAT